MTSADPEASIAQSLALVRRRQRRSTLAGSLELHEIYGAEVADIVAGAGEVLTVGDIARALTLDPSQASRRVKASIDAGLITRISLQHDGRLSGLRLTTKGESVVADLRRRREGVVARATRSWTTEDRERLAHLLIRFMSDLRDAEPT